VFLILFILFILKNYVTWRLRLQVGLFQAVFLPFLLGGEASKYLKPPSIYLIKF